MTRLLNLNKILSYIMNIHFLFPLASYDWPLIRLLSQKFPQATFDCSGGRKFGKYHNRFQLIIRMPWLACYAFNSLMVRKKNLPLPDYVCVGSDVEVIGCLLAKLLIPKKIHIILVGFIYTPRKSKIITKIRWLYFRLLLSQVLGVICYSKLEKLYLPNLFRLKKTIFESIPFGGNLDIPQDFVTKKEGQQKYLVSAGRSGRDYGLLCEAVKSLPIELHIICDSNHALEGIIPPPNVKILRNCYGSEYIKELAESDMVLLPLKNEKISSGQMVLVDAMALGKVTIITETATSIEYGEHLKTCYFVKPDSVEEIRSAINICSGPHISKKISQEAKQHYSDHHSIAPYVSSLADAILKIQKLNQ